MEKRCRYCGEILTLDHVKHRGKKFCNSECVENKIDEETPDYYNPEDDSE